MSIFDRKYENPCLKDKKKKKKKKKKERKEKNRKKKKKKNPYRNQVFLGSETSFSFWKLKPRFPENIGSGSIKGGMGNLLPSLPEALPHSPPPAVRRKKWPKLAIFGKCLGFCPLRIAFCPLDCPPTTKILVPPLNIGYS